MSFQIGIGDVVLLAQQSWRVVQALSNGRKSAPAELRDVEHHLSLLTTALEGAKDLSSSIDKEGGQQKLAACLGTVADKCRITLRHLEDTIKKYRTVNEPSVLPKSAFGRLNDSLGRNWRKVEWTTERGNLQALRDELMMHTNSINLILGLSTNARTMDMTSFLSSIHKMTKDLHLQYDEPNFAKTRGAQPTVLSDNVPKKTEGGMQTQSGTYSTTQATFELELETENGLNTICPQAAFDQTWLEALARQDTGLHLVPFLVCRCPMKKPSSGPHHDLTVGAFLATASSFPARQAGRELVWRILRVANKGSNTFVTLQLRKLHPQYLSALQDIVLRLAVRQGDTILQQGQGNSLAHIDSSGHARLLESISYLRESANSVTTFQIAANNRTVTSENIASITILRYRTLEHTRAQKPAPKVQIKTLPNAEIVVTYSNDDDDLYSNCPIRSILTMHRSTRHELDEDDAAVIISSICLESEYADGRQIQVADVTATMEFASLKAAKEFGTAIGDMRFELYIDSMRCPNPNERVVSLFPASQVECQGEATAVYIDEALVSIFETTTDGTDHSDAPTRGPRYRLVLASRNGNTVVSQVLPRGLSPSQIQDPVSKPDGTLSIFSSGGTTDQKEAFVAQVDQKGIWRLRKFEKGFKSMMFNSEQAGVGRGRLDLMDSMTASAHSEQGALSKMSFKELEGAERPLPILAVSASSDMV
ncbi:NACHT-NTPase domain-containing protein [Microdochium nivale]|nr:NACHT-NTPase domain-containing protein [Microdochium nivale]